ncbi:MAG: NAD(P)/FAD-dependent oxidoreductase [Roseburia sp.]|nr:NAD(P)/FAD-dependent oxidoreductase [Roseburia sp.]
MKKYELLVVGAGAAGMMAAAAAGAAGADVCIAERNEKAGKKIYITGKGRCNITNACDTENLFQNVVSNRKFLYSSFYSFTNFDVMDFFEKCGIGVKVERGNRVFPKSDKSSDVIKALQKECEKNGVTFLFHSKVTEIITEDGKAAGVRLENGNKLFAEKIIVTTGGMSYPSTGSDGDGFRFAKETGHGITPCSPALVPMNIQGGAPAKMQGLSLKNVELSFFIRKENGGEKELYREFGEMMFTHFGITGPVVLSASCYIGKELANQPVFVRLDCKPALLKEKLHKRIVRDFEAAPKISLKNAMGGLLPKSLIPVMLEMAEAEGDKPVNQITKEERERLVNTMKGMVFRVASLRGWNEAVITAGGVSVKEINPSTMESRRIKNLYFAGEVLDVHALTGGFNLQIAWSTGYLAGKSAADGRGI